MRIAIVNDITIALESLRRVVTSGAGYSVAWTARNGAEAVAQCLSDTPDLILMDLVMPVMNGVEATRRIMAQTPCAILVVAAAVSKDSKNVLDAISAGALDAIQTPIVTTNGSNTGSDKLKSKIESIRTLLFEGTREKRFEGSHHLSSELIAPLVIFGASAGGPAALATIMRELPGDFPAPIVIVQHIDEQFAPAMADWLEKQSNLAVRIARNGDVPKIGVALLAGTNTHLVVDSAQRLAYTAEPRNSYYHPSVDVFFQSVARHWKGKVIAVLLTGMGRDGARGLKVLREIGVLTAAQDASSSVVYGMPKAAAELDAAAEILPLCEIPIFLRNAVKSTCRKRS